MTPERVEEIYSRVEKLDIVLDSDPASRGPAYLQDLIAKTRGYLNETAHYIQETLREKHRSEMDLEAEEAAYEVRGNELLATDNRVTRLPNIDDRRAMIAVILADDRRRISSLKRLVRSSSNVEKVVRHRHKELENTMSAIRLQRSLVETEIRTGSYFGDEGDASRGRGGRTSSAPDVDDFDEDEIRDLWDQAHTPDPPPEPPPPEPKNTQVLPGTSSPSSVVPPQAHAAEDDQHMENFLNNDIDLGSIFDSV